MWTSIITGLILPLAIKLMNLYFNSKAATAEQRKAYLEFLAVWQKTPNTPSSIHDSYQEQLKKLAAQAPTQE